MVPNEFGDLARQTAYSCVLNDLVENQGHLESSCGFGQLSFGRAGERRGGQSFQPQLQKSQEQLHKYITGQAEKEKHGFFLSLPKIVMFTVRYRKNEQCLGYGDAEDCFYSVQCTESL